MQPDLLEKLRERCHVKRIYLYGYGQKVAQKKSGLTLAAGIIALLSGASITSILIELTSSIYVEILAAALAFLAGLISLVGRGILNDEEIAAIFKGANEYLGLRNEIELLIVENNMDVEKLKLLQERYTQLDGRYARYTALIHPVEKDEYTKYPSSWINRLLISSKDREDILSSRSRYDS